MMELTKKPLVFVNDFWLPSDVDCMENVWFLLNRAYFLHQNAIKQAQLI